MWKCWSLYLVILFSETTVVSSRPIGHEVLRTRQNTAHDAVEEGGEQLNVRIHTGTAMWNNGSSWCVATEASGTVCTTGPQRLESGETPCGRERDEEMWLDNGSFVLCSCSPEGVVCTRMDHPDRNGHTNDFLGKMCRANAAWYDGRKWCICDDNSPGVQVDVYCAKPIREQKPSMSCSWLSLSESRKQLCACSGTSGACVLKTFSDNNAVRQRRSLRRWRPRIASAASAMDTGCGGRPIGTRWTDGCNVCLCSNAQVALCTAKHCRLEYDNLKTG